MRNPAIDIAKGICILLMILGHCQGMDGVVYKAIESFHMPFFFCAAGFFFRSQDILNLAKKSFVRLIVPLLIGVAVCAAIYLAWGKPEVAMRWGKALLFPGGTARKIFFYPNWPNTGVFWFLAALFWCRLICNTLFQLTPKYILIICALLSWITIIVGRRVILPFGISEGCSGLIFYAAGHFANNYNLYSRSVKWYAIVLILVLWLVDIHCVTFRMFQLAYTWYLYPIGVIFACLMSWLVYKLAHYVSSFRWSNGLRLCGLYSLEMMCCHQVARVVCSLIPTHTHTSAQDLEASLILVALSLLIAAVYILIKRIVLKKIAKQ